MIRLFSSSLLRSLTISFAIVGFVSLLGTAAMALPAKGLFAEIETNKGTISIRLFYKKAPKTVSNFIALSEGTKDWADPETNRIITGKPLYKNLKFHRVISKFMVQTGDPAGNGTGGPGFNFEDEFHKDLKHNKPGILSMANRGRNTNGSQFFITHIPTPWLDWKHTVFGEVIEGMDIVNLIEKGDDLKQIRILRQGTEAKAFAVETSAVQAQEAFKKKLPKKFGKLDASRVPKAGQVSVDAGDFEYIFLGFKGVTIPPAPYQYTHEEILKIAEGVAREARSEGVEFREVIRKYSDTMNQFQLKSFKKTAQLPPLFHDMFKLKPGQIADPTDTADGVFIFKRIK